MTDYLSSNGGNSPRKSADRNLLVGILALQMDFVDRGQLITAMNAWVLDKSKPLEVIFETQGALDEETQELLCDLVRKHLEKHNNEADKSLASVSSVPSPVHEELRAIGDATVEATLANLAKDGARDSEASVPLRPRERMSRGERFVVLRPHARGGLGEVSVAKDLELNREVALKEIHERFADNASSRARFLLEAEVTGSLEHPGIVPVYGLGQYSDGRPFYAMRFVRGDSFKEAADRFHANPSNINRLRYTSEWSGRRAHQKFHSVEFRRLLGRFVDVCNAIEYAHSRGVLHRDLKPENVMLGKYGETLVVDWGLAKAVGRREDSKHERERTLRPSSGRSSASTQVGSAIGTPAFMSPEQAAGRLQDLGPKSDIYSLGATLYYLLVGRAPVVELDLGVTLRKVQAGDFEAPRSINQQVPKDLEAVCLKAMSTKIEERYESPSQLASEIEKWLADQPISARTATVVERAGRFSRRHRSWTMAGATALTLTAFILTLAVVVVNESRRNERLQRGLAEGLAERNERLAREERGAKELAEAASDEARAALFEMNTSSGITAAELGKPAEAMLWFANAASIAEPGSTEEEESRIRIRAWSHIVPTPVRTMDHGERLTSMQFDSTGQLLITLTSSARCRVWELDQQTDPREVPFSVSAVACNPRKLELAVGQLNGTVRVLSLPDLKPIDQDDIKFDEPISSLAYSSDGALLAVAGDSLRIWDRTQRQFLPQAYQHPAEIDSVQFSESGDLLLTACTDNYARVYGLRGENSNQPLFEPFFHLAKGRTDQTLPRPRFINEGKGLIANSICYDLATGKATATLHESDLTYSQVSPNGRDVAFETHNGVVRLWKYGEGVQPLTIPKAGAFAFSPDGAELAFSTSNDSIARIDLHSGDLLEGEIPSFFWVEKLSYSPDGRRLVAAKVNGRVVVWLLNGKSHREPSGRTETVRRLVDSRSMQIPLRGRSTDLTTSPSGRYLLPTGGNRWFGTLSQTQVLSSENLQPIGRLIYPNALLLDACFSPDETQVVTASTNNQLMLWDWRAGQRIGSPVHLPSEPLRLQYSPHSNLIHVLCIDGIIHAIEMATGTIRYSVRHGSVEPKIYQRDKFAHGYRRWNGYPTGSFDNYQLEMSRDGRWLISFGIDSEVRVWDATSGRLRYPPIALSNKAEIAGLSSDDRYLALRNPVHDVEVFDFRSGELVSPRLRHSDRITQIAFSDDGKKLMTTTYKGEACVWDWREGKLVCQPIAEPVERLIGLLLEPSGDRIAIASDHSATLWSTLTGHQLSPPYPVDGYPLKMLLCGNGRLACIAGNYRPNRGSIFGSRINAIPLEDIQKRQGISTSDYQVFSEILSQRSIRDSVKVNLDTREWDDRLAAFREHYPEYLRADWDHDEVVAWHKHQIDRNSRHNDQFAAEWHLKQLATLLGHDNPEVSIKKGRLRLKEAVGLAAGGNIDEALHAWRDAGWSELVETDKPCIDLAIALAMELIRASEVELAQRVLEDSIRNWHPHEQSHVHLLNQFCWNLVKTREASSSEGAVIVDVAKKLTEVDPKQASVWNTLGVALYRQENWHDAIDALEQSILIGDGANLAYDAFFLAMCYARLGEKSLAEESFVDGCRWMNENKPEDAVLVDIRTETQELLDSLDIDSELLVDDPEPQIANENDAKSNLVEHPSFEQSLVNRELPSGWYGIYSQPKGSFQSQTIELGDSGRLALQIEGSGDRGSVMSKRIAIDQEKKYVARVSVMSERQGHSVAELGIAISDIDDRRIGFRNKRVRLANNQWQDISIYLAPVMYPQAKYYRLELSLIGNGQAVFDDAELFINGDIGPADLAAARARKHASRGEWKKASAAYEELVAQRPQVSWFQVSLATLHVANNDLEAFHRQCQKLLNALSIQGQMDNNLPRTVAMTCALVPESKIDLDIPLKLASRALEEAFTPPESKNAHFTLSLIYYRKGDYEAARGHASKASEWEAPSHTQAMSLLVACMAQHQAGELETAKKTIEEADRIIAQVPALNTTTGDLWWPWLVIQILRNEAGQLSFEEGKTNKN